MAWVEEANLYIIQKLKTWTFNFDSKLVQYLSLLLTLYW